MGKASNASNNHDEIDTKHKYPFFFIDTDAYTIVTFNVYIYKHNFIKVIHIGEEENTT